MEKFPALNSIKLTDMIPTEFLGMFASNYSAKEIHSLKEFEVRELKPRAKAGFNGVDS